ncbi:ABC-type transport auxiliary lipoprotein family protein [Neptunomonas antarctica]|uniref:Cholesterol transport system auxiliary component n=1 Tax=Neptunomonas antarctica TaxID=619304 RepID=A0A1N7P529_9GAMM|nr:ABC-type transport auxiliary lipoprotein family protein [Neptunomonas antarctica]SIT05684.1 cholesterol transport system auxiliary component [Neptunomonas antarctica]
MRSRFLILCFLCNLLAGCATTTFPPVDVYTISLLSNYSNDRVEIADHSNVILKVSPVRGARPFTSTAFLYKDTQHGLNHYAYSRWSDVPVKILQTYFQVALEKSAQFRAVVPTGSVSNADYLLESTLLDFSHHINDDGSSDGVIRVRFYVINNATKTVLATTELVSKVPASLKNAQGAAVALNIAASNVARDLVFWVIAGVGKI